MSKTFRSWDVDRSWLLPPSVHEFVAPGHLAHLGMLFTHSLGYEPAHRGRRARLEELRTRDGKPLPIHLKRQISRVLDRLELVLKQIETVEAERNGLLASDGEVPTPGTMLMDLKGVGAEFAKALWTEGLFCQFGDRPLSPRMADWHDAAAERDDRPRAGSWQVW